MGTLWQLKYITNWCFAPLVDWSIGTIGTSDLAIELLVDWHERSIIYIAIELATLCCVAGDAIIRTCRSCPGGSS